MKQYGMDFGNSGIRLAATSQYGNTVEIKNHMDGSWELAAAVCFPDPDEILFGETARQFLCVDESRVVRSIKKELGRIPGRTYKFDGKTYTATEISALLLNHFRELVTWQGEALSEVVMTVPVFSDHNYLMALKHAVELAGLRLIEFIPEPTAAALSFHYMYCREMQNVLVFDLGSSSLKISMLHRQGERIQRDSAPVYRIVAAQECDDLSGYRWTERIYQSFLMDYCDEFGLTYFEIDAELHQELFCAAEQAQQMLSFSEVGLSRFCKDNRFKCLKVTREAFEALTEDLAERAMDQLEACIHNAGNIQPDTVLITGQGAQLPLFSRLLERKFPGKVQPHFSCGAYSMGAAIYGQMAASASGQETAAR